MYFIVVGLIFVCIIAVVVYCATPPDMKPLDISDDDPETIWRRMYYNGKFCGYIRLYPESLDILEEIKEEGGNRRFEFKELLEEDYV